jgi:hypothetical protein
MGEGDLEMVIKRLSNVPLLFAGEGKRVRVSLFPSSQPSPIYGRRRYGIKRNRNVINGIARISKSPSPVSGRRSG